MNAFLQHKWWAPVAIAFGAMLLFFPLLGNIPLFDWDEINFAECAREMVVSGNYSETQLYFQPFWEKPPLFIWMQALCMNVFGVNEMAARLPNAIGGIVTLVIIFLIGRRHFFPTTGLFWVLLYTGCLLPHLYFKSGIIDPWFNLFIFLSVYFFLLFSNFESFSQQWRYALASGIFIGLAVLTKGPTALLIMGLVILTYIILKKQFRLLVSKGFLLFIVSAVVVGGSWFLYEIANGKMNVVKEFITYQIRLFSTEDAGHSGPYMYHFFILLVGCFPASILFVSNYSNKEALSPFQKHFRLFTLLLFWVVLILFSIVKTKIVHYSSLCYLPLTGIATFGITVQFSTLKIEKWNRVLFWILNGILSLVFIVAGFFPLIKDAINTPELIPDVFTRQNLKTDLPWQGWEWLIGVLFFACNFVLFGSVIKKNVKHILYSLVGLTITILLCINVFTSRATLVSQQAAIDFYKQCAMHDCYVESVRYKSYAPLFYGNRQMEHFQHPDFVQFYSEAKKEYLEKGESPVTHISMIYTRWLLERELDKPAYFVCKIQDEKELFTNLRMRKLYSKNGFSFFVKMPNKH
jgi:4-amino-4-deoxy-L-arabinose transferase-like glycosyltransferase